MGCSGPVQRRGVPLSLVSHSRHIRLEFFRPYRAASCPMRWKYQAINPSSPAAKYGSFPVPLLPPPSFPTSQSALLYMQVQFKTLEKTMRVPSSSLTGCMMIRRFRVFTPTNRSLPSFHLLKCAADPFLIPPCYGSQKYSFQSARHSPALCNSDTLRTGSCTG